MNIKVVMRVLSFVLLVITCFMFIPLVVSLTGWGYHGIADSATVWVVSILAGLATVIVLSLAGGAWWRIFAPGGGYSRVRDGGGCAPIAVALWGGASDELGMREGAAIVSFAWVIASVLGAMPYVLSGVLPNFADAFFETMSGFTTTGATVMTAIESAPASILFWRGLTHWIGGMGIIVLTLVLLPLLGLSSMALFKSEVPGPTVEKLTPRLQRTALCLWGLYAGMTALEAVFLKLGGMSVFESVIHSFSTIATGGFSTRDASIAAFDSAYIEWVLIIFMFMAGVNFSITFYVLRHILRCARVALNSEGRDIQETPVLRLKTRKIAGHIREMFTSESELGDQELRGYACVVLFASLLIALGLYFTQNLGVAVPSDAAVAGALSPFFHEASESIRGALFHVVSLITTTGFVANDYGVWPQYAQFLMLFVMIIGACAGSTGGGCKVTRFQMLNTQVRMEVTRTLHPRVVATARLNGKTVSRDLIESAAAFLMLYLAILVAATLAVMMLGTGDARLDVITSLSGVIACLSNVGPGLANLGPTENFAWLTGATKIILSLCMLVGRLELFTVLILFMPQTWRH